MLLQRQTSARKHSTNSFISIESLDGELKLASSDLSPKGPTIDGVGGLSAKETTRDLTQGKISESCGENEDSGKHFASGDLTSAMDTASKDSATSIGISNESHRANVQGFSAECSGDKNGNNEESSQSSHTSHATHGTQASQVGLCLSKSPSPTIASLNASGADATLPETPSPDSAFPASGASIGAAAVSDADVNAQHAAASPSSSSCFLQPISFSGLHTQSYPFQTLATASPVPNTSLPPSSSMALPTIPLLHHVQQTHQTKNSLDFQINQIPAMASPPPEEQGKHGVRQSNTKPNANGEDPKRVLETRIQQLEQSLHSLSYFCNSLILQQQQQQFQWMQHQHQQERQLHQEKRAEQQQSQEKEYQIEEQSMQRLRQMHVQTLGAEGQHQSTLSAQLREQVSNGGDFSADADETTRTEDDHDLHGLTNELRKVIRKMTRHELHSGLLQEELEKMRLLVAGGHIRIVSGGSHVGAHRRQETGESTSGNLSYSPNSNPSPSSGDDPYNHYVDSETRILSKWPPSHQNILDSPDASVRRSGLPKKSGRQTLYTPSRHLSKASKTMSMVLLDLELGENRGPSMIPFTEDLDVDDEMDGDSFVGGGAGSAGGSLGEQSSKSGNGSGSSNRGSSERGGIESTSITLLKEDANEFKSNKIEGKKTHSSSNLDETPSPDIMADEDSSRPPLLTRKARRLSSSLEEPTSPNTPLVDENRLECQNYTKIHLEALRLRREAGKIRAYSFNDTPTLRKGNGSANRTAATSESLRQPYENERIDEAKKPVVDDSPLNSDKSLFKVIHHSKDHKTTMSIDTFVKMGDSDESPVIFQNLKQGSSGDDKPDIFTPDLSSIGRSLELAPLLKRDSTATSGLENQKSIDSLTSASIPECTSSQMGQSASSHSIATVKSGSGTNSTKLSSIAVCSGNESRERSASLSDSRPKSEEGSATTTAKAISKAVTKAVNKTGDKTLSSTVPVDTKGKQTMLEYVKDDLLNIDSRHQDGSATEDIDANMEEFLRVPFKLEKMMVFSLAVSVDSFLYVWTLLPLKVLWGMVCLFCTLLRPGRGVGGIMFHRRHLYALLQSLLLWFVFSQVLCPISIGKLYHWIRGQAMLKLYVLIAIVEVFDRLLCSFGQDAWDSLYWNTTRRPRHPRMLISMIVVGVYVTVHSLFLFVHVATLSVAVNSADNALLTLLISGNFAEIKSTVFKKYNKQNLFKITTSDICERFKLALFLSLILLLNCFQVEMTTSMVKDYYSMCGIVLVAELISDWVKHSFITKFNFIKSSAYFDYALIISGDVTGIGHEGLNLDYTHAAVKRLGLAQIPLVCVTARYLHEAVRFAVAFRGNGDVDHPMSALAELLAEGNKFKFYLSLLGGMLALIGFKVLLGVCIRFVAGKTLGGNIKGAPHTAMMVSSVKAPKVEKEQNDGARGDKKDVKKKQ